MVKQDLYALGASSLDPFRGLSCCALSVPILLPFRASHCVLHMNRHWQCRTRTGSVCSVNFRLGQCHRRVNMVGRLQQQREISDSGHMHPCWASLRYAHFHCRHILEDLNSSVVLIVVWCVYTVEVNKLEVLRHKMLGAFLLDWVQKLNRKILQLLYSCGSWDWQILVLLFLMGMFYVDDVIISYVVWQFCEIH